MRLMGLGHPVFAVALAGFGVLSLSSGDFAYLWQPVPPWLLGHPLLAYASGALLLVCGVPDPIWIESVSPSLPVGGV